MNNIKSLTRLLVFGFLFFLIHSPAICFPGDDLEKYDTGQSF